MKQYFDTRRGAKQAGKLRGWQFTGINHDYETGKYTIYEMDGEWIRSQVEAGARMRALLLGPCV